MPGTISFSETFENGTNGADIDGGNSNFNTFTGTASATFDTTYAAFGTKSLKVVNTGVSFANVRYVFPASKSVVFVRFAIYLTAYPGAPLFISTATGVTNPARLLLSATGNIILRDFTTTVDTSTNAIPLNTWTVLEWRVNDTTTTQSARLYTGLTGSVLETISGAYTQGVMDGWHIGISTAVAGTIWFDQVDLAYDDWLGPFSDRPTSAWLSL